MKLWSKGVERSRTGEDRLGEGVFTDEIKRYLDKIRDFIKEILRNYSAKNNDVKYTTNGNKLIWTISGYRIPVEVDDPESMYNIYSCIHDALKHHRGWSEFPLNVIELIMYKNIARHEDMFFKNYEILFKTDYAHDIIKTLIKKNCQKWDCGQKE